MQERLQKIIAQAGITSRRKAELLITEGRVMVNGTVVSTLGSKADPVNDYIKIDGKLIKKPADRIYLILNKPVNYLTTLNDPLGRPTVIDLLKGVNSRVYPIGRLDWQSEGLLLLTNDGEFAQAMSHPGFEIKKTYRVKIKDDISHTQLDLLRTGVDIKLKSGELISCEAHYCKDALPGKHRWIEVTIAEGKNRQIRRMLEAVNCDVLKLKRVAYGPLKLRGLSRGCYRSLTEEELTRLKQAAAQGKTDPYVKQRPK